MTLRIRQIVLAVHDLDTAVDNLTTTLGIEVAYRDPEVAKFGLKNAIMPIGDQFLEVVTPIKDNTPAGRLLERRGDSGYMLILQTDNLTKDRARLDRLGVRIIWESIHEDIQAIHLHPRDIGGTIVSLDQPIPPTSWRWAGPNWQKHVNQHRTQQILGAEIEAHDPQAMAQRWKEVLELEEPVKHNSTWRLQLTEGTIRFTQADQRGEGLSAVDIKQKVTETKPIPLHGVTFRPNNIP